MPIHNSSPNFKLDGAQLYEIKGAQTVNNNSHHSTSINSGNTNNYSTINSNNNYTRSFNHSGDTHNNNYGNGTFNNVVGEQNNNNTRIEGRRVRPQRGAVMSNGQGPPQNQSVYAPPPSGLPHRPQTVPQFKSNNPFAKMVSQNADTQSEYPLRRPHLRQLPADPGYPIHQILPDEEGYASDSDGATVDFDTVYGTRRTEDRATE